MKTKVKNDLMNESFHKIINMASKYANMKIDFDRLQKENLKLKMALSNNIFNDCEILNRKWRKENLQTKLSNKLKEYFNISNRTNRESTILREEINLIIDALKVL